MANFGLFRGFSEKLFQGELPINLGMVKVNFDDSDALAFFTRVTDAGGTLSDNEKLAVLNLTSELKAYDIWNSMKAIYPMVGSSAAACAQNLKSSSFTGVFYGSWIFTNTGATPTSAYMDTNFNLLSNLSNRNIHISYYARSGDFGGERTLIGTSLSETAGAPLYNYYNSSKAYATLGSAYIDAVIPNILAFHTLTSLDNSTNGQRLFTNGVLRGTATNSTSAFVNTTLLLNRGYAFSPLQCAFASVGDNLTNAQASLFYNAVQAFQTTLSRQV